MILNAVHLLGQRFFMSQFAYGNAILPKIESAYYFENIAYIKMQKFVALLFRFA